MSNTNEYEFIGNYKLESMQYITNKRLIMLIFANGISVTLWMDEKKIQLIDRYQRLSPVISDDENDYKKIKEYAKKNMGKIAGKKYIGK